MLLRLVGNWWRAHRAPVFFGSAAGLLWGFLTVATVAPRAWLVYDQHQGLVVAYALSGELLDVIPADVFFRNYYGILVQAVLLLLAVTGLAGWATWQHMHVRPRGEAQVPLREGTDWYVIALALGGLAVVVAFVKLGSVAWLQGGPTSPPALVAAVISIALPLYMGVSLFFLWFRRLASIKPPDWETRYRPAFSGPSGAGWWRRLWHRGGKPPDE